MKKIDIFDTTLRDGEQAPGATMNAKEKITLAKQLEKLNVDIIEAGFPIASPGDFDAVKTIAENIKGRTIAALARATSKDIETAARALEKAEKPRIHTFIATSPVHMKYKLRMEPEVVLERARQAVRLAKKYVDDVEFSAEDAGRSDLEFLYKVYAAAIEEGATVLNVPDTVGYKLPDEFGRFIKSIKQNTKGIEKAKISVHCHNDLGLAVANSIAAIQNGAEQVECTVNGVGERAGNAAMEELVMILKTRTDILGDYFTDINSKQFYNTSKMVETFTGFYIPKNKAIIGINAFKHESGIHQDGVLKERSTYEILKPEDIGVFGDNIVLGKHSGRHAFKVKVEEMGYNLEDSEIENLYKKFLKLADNLKEVKEQDIRAIIDGERTLVDEEYKVLYVSVSSGTQIPSAVVRLSKSGEEFTETSIGDGPVDAAYKAIDKIVGEKSILLDYNIKSTSETKETLGEARVRIKGSKGNYTGIGASTDIIEASVKAYLHAINKMIFEEQKGGE
ncbi:2-isopropylmalate synthase [Haliovirga abyssi]|uniref:2-isopropylmalate synthase n=1 Tax=Haliovirga abyssi TaxID=2996794 RepID=A0AAU9DZZ2_9FUSO|nr:2-isopropylmalate synthase [Haliovirga abyssi]BDU51170.1 2-isopropylmalate synthase [Haliovirga abyssi]